MASLENGKLRPVIGKEFRWPKRLRRMFSQFQSPAYLCYPDLAFKDWSTAYYGAENYARLQQLKQRYDPENRIHYPQSVQLPD